MLVIEYKCQLTTVQQENVDKWLELLPSTWNVALGALEEFDRFTGWRTTEGYAPCCPLPWDVIDYAVDDRGIVIEDRRAKSKSVKKIEAFKSDCCRIYFVDVGGGIIDNRGRAAIDKKVGEELYAPCCPLKRDWVQPPIKDPDYGLCATIKSDFVKQRCPWTDCVPFKYRQAKIQDLAKAWKEYVKSKQAFSKAKKTKSKAPTVFRGKPQYKRHKDKITTLAYANAKPDKYGKGGVRPDPKSPDMLLGMPALGAVCVPGLEKRWPKVDGALPPVCVAKIAKRASGYYLQLTLDVDKVKRCPPSNKAISIDPGLRYIISFDDPYKRPVEPPKYFRNSQALLAKRQRQASKKRTQRLLVATQTMTAAQMLEKVPKLKDRADAIARARPKTHKELVAAIMATNPAPKSEAGRRQQVRRANQLISLLAWKLTDASNRQKKLDNRIARQHEKIRLQRRNFNHKLSTFLVRTYGAIIIEDIKVSQMNRQVLPKLKPDGSYAHNNQKGKRDQNISWADAALGQLLTMIEQKAQWAGREFIRVPAHYTTMDCPNPKCNHRQKVPLSNRTRVCQKCGLAGDQDHLAAVKIRSLAEPLLKGKFLRSRGMDTITMWLHKKELAA